jgi:hypothetical protein
MSNGSNDHTTSLHTLQAIHCNFNVCFADELWANETISNFALLMKHMQMKQFQSCLVNEVYTNEFIQMVALLMKWSIYKSCNFKSNRLEIENASTSHGHGLCKSNQISSNHVSSNLFFIGRVHYAQNTILWLVLYNYKWINN